MLFSQHCTSSVSFSYSCFYVRNKFFHNLVTHKYRKTEREGESDELTYDVLTELCKQH